MESRRRVSTIDMRCGGGGEGQKREEEEQNNDPVRLSRSSRRDCQGQNGGRPETGSRKTEAETGGIECLTDKRGW